MANNPTVVKSLKIVSWNACSIIGKKLELQEFIEENNVDIVLLSETWLHNGLQLKIPNYKIYRNDRQNRPGGGTAILIKSKIKHDLFSTPDLVHLECTIIQIYVANIGPVKVIAAYLPPNVPFLPNEFDSVLNTNSPLILAGDLNSKSRSWGCRSTNRHGTILDQYTENNNINILAPLVPTFFGTNGVADILDIALTKNFPNHININSPSVLSSDHNPIVLEIGDPPTTDVISNQITDWDKFRTIIGNKLTLSTKLLCETDLDNEVEHFTSQINSAIQEATTTRTKPVSKIGIPLSIKNLIREKNRARKRAQLTLSPVDKQIATSLNNQVKQKLTEFRNTQWDLKVESIISSNELHKLTKSLKNSKSSVQLPPISSTNGIAYTVDDKAEAFADSLESQMTENETIDWENEENIENTIENLPTNTNHEIPIYTSVSTIKNIISKLSNKKAPGPDGIKNSILKILPKKCLGVLTSIINAMFRLNHFPSKWKMADVVVIHKAGTDPKFPANYRPISLISSIGKVAEAVILKKIDNFTQHNNIIQNEQFGFRHNHSTTMQANRVIERITEGFSNKEMTGAVLLDVAKAFDKVYHSGLIFKLLNYDFPIKLILLIKSFLQNRKFRVKLTGTLSSWRNIEAGVPQGSLLSPILFNIYMSDLPTPDHVQLAAYADDVMVFATNRSPKLIRNRLNTALEIISNWYQKWKIKINSTKTKAILFNKNIRNPTIGPIFIENQPIQWTESAKYLGITMDRKLLFRDHITNVINKAKTVKRQLYCLIGRNSKLNLRLKVQIYKQYIRPILLYSSPTWCCAANTHVKKIQTLQNITLRQIVNAPWYIRNKDIHKDLKIRDIKDEIILSTEKLYSKAENHSNDLLRESLTYETENTARCLRPRQFLDRQ